MDLAPADPHTPLAQRLAEELVLLVSPREHRDEAAAVDGDVLEVVAGAQLAVGHVDEVLALQQGPQQIDVADMHGVVGPVAAEDVVQQGDCPVAGDVEPKQQLLEVGPVVLVHPVGDTGLGHRRGVLPEEGHRRGVEVDAAGRQLEVLDHPQGEAEEDAAAALAGEGLQAAGDAVVVEVLHLGRRQPQGLRLDALCPLPDPVEGTAGDQDVVDQHGQDLGVVEAVPQAGAHAAAHDLAQGHALEVVAQQGVGSQQMSPQGGGRSSGGHGQLPVG